MKIKISHIDSNTAVIFVDGRDTGLRVAQQKNGTVLYQSEVSAPQARSLGCETRPYREISLPYSRYSLAHDAPASGAAGRAQFEADLLAILHARQ